MIVGIFEVSISLLAQNGDKIIIPIQLTAIDCFPDQVNPFQEVSNVIYTLMGLSGSEYSYRSLSEHYSNPENFDIFLIELEHILALLGLTRDLDKKYNGLFSSQLMNYFDDLITKVTQLKTRIKNKEIKIYLLRYEFESLFDRLPFLDTESHPLEFVEDKF